MTWTYYVIIDDKKYSFSENKELIISKDKNEEIFDMPSDVYDTIKDLHYKQNKEKEKLVKKNKSLVLPNLSDEGREISKSSDKYNL